MTSSEWLWGAEVNQNFDPANPERDHRPIGAILRFDDGASAAVIFDLSEAEKYSRIRWTVESWAPLTLSPDMRDPVSGHVGHMRHGVWIEDSLR